MGACRCRSMPPGSTAARGDRGSACCWRASGSIRRRARRPSARCPAASRWRSRPMPSNPAKLLDAARLAEHEYLLSIPMEPQGFPLNDPGKQALMTNLSPEQNRTRLDWVLSRIAGYVGRDRRGGQPARRTVRLAARGDQSGAGGAVPARAAVCRSTPGRSAAAAGLEQERGSRAR